MASAAIRPSHMINLLLKMSSSNNLTRTLLPPNSPTIKVTRRRSEDMRLKPSKLVPAPMLSLVVNPQELLSNSALLPLNQAMEVIKLSLKLLPLRVTSIPRVMAHSNPLLLRFLSMVIKRPTKDTQHLVPRSPRLVLVASPKELAA
jgi:hypothetical protein